MSISSSSAGALLHPHQGTGVLLLRQALHVGKVRLEGKHRLQALPGLGGGLEGYPQPCTHSPPRLLAPLPPPLPGRLQHCLTSPLLPSSGAGRFAVKYPSADNSH